MVHYKLTYFNGRGRAELSRLILAAAGQTYEDNRIEKDAWESLKPNTLLGTLPILEVQDGSNVFVLSQSIAVARFLAKKFNLAGQTDIEQAEADMYVDQAVDLFTEIVKVFFEQDETKKEAASTKLISEIVPRHLKIFVAKLQKTNTGFLVGNSLTWADLFVMGLIESFGEGKAAVFEHFPLAKIHYEKITSIPNIAKWLSTRPQTPF